MKNKENDGLDDDEVKDDKSKNNKHKKPNVRPHPPPSDEGYQGYSGVGVVDDNK